MADLTLRLEKGSELTFREIDDNFLNLDSELHYVMSQLDSGLDDIRDRLDSEHAWNVYDHSQLQANIDSVNARVTSRDSAVVNKVILDLVDSAYVQARQIDSMRDSDWFKSVFDSDYVKARVTTDQDLGTQDDVEFQHIHMTHASGALSFAAVNNTGSQITKGSVVYINGVAGTTPTIALASNSNSATMPAYGLAYEDISDGDSGHILTFGTSSIMDTSSFAVGETLYVGAVPGELTNTKPSGTALIQNIAKVQRVHASAGLVKVGGAGRTNDTPNLMSGQIFYGNTSNYSVATNLTDVVDSAYLSDFITNGFLDSIGVGKTLASTDELPEGSNNLYYRDDRVNSLIAQRTSDSVQEGSVNLYFTDDRARNAVSAGNGISYTAGTGVFTVAGNTNLDQDADGLSLSSAITGLTDVGTNKVSLGANWTIELSGNDLLFKFGGSSKMKLTSAGALTTSGDITAFGSP